MKHAGTARERCGMMLMLMVMMVMLMLTVVLVLVLLLRSQMLERTGSPTSH